MTALRPAAVLLAAAVALLGGCGKPASGTASGQPAVSSAPPSRTAAAPQPTVAVAPPPPAATPPATTPQAAAPPAPAPVAETRREPTAAELLRSDPGYISRERRIESLYSNAKERDPTGQVEREQNIALAERRACADRACLDRWFSRRESALRQYVDN